MMFGRKKNGVKKSEIMVIWCLVKEREESIHLETARGEERRIFEK